VKRTIRTKVEDLMAIRKVPATLKDFIATHLRAQIHKLQGVLEHVEGETSDGGFVASSLKDVETGLKQIRKVCESN
jgi:hypothetical protein